MISAVEFMEPTQEQIMSWLLKDKVELNRMYISPFRDDKHPTCSFWYSNEGKLFFHDFGTGKMYTAIKFAMELWKVDWVHAKKRIERNYPDIWKIEVEPLVKQEFIYEYIPAKYIGDYWSRYNISEQTLKLFRVSYAKTLYINGDLAGRSTSANPIFIYNFESERIKIYRPLTPDRKKKWGGNSNMNDIGGLSCLPKKGTVAFITSSIKDAMVLREHGFSAVCMQGEGYGSYGESVGVMKGLISLLKSRFRYVFFFMDSDEPGKSYSAKLKEIHGLECCFTTKVKDISDHEFKYGKNATTRLIKKQIVKAWIQNQERVNFQLQH